VPADSLLKARTPEPTGHGGRNWLTRLKPGNRGEQPAYIQHIVHALMTKRGMPQSRAEAIAVSAPKRWLHSRHADKGTKAASALAVGQWEKDRALSRLRRAGRAVATQASEVPVTVTDTAAVCEHELEVFASIEEAIGADVLEAAVARVEWADYRPLSPREHVLDELAERAAEALTLVEATRTREIGSGKFTNYLKRISNAPGAGPCANCGALKLADKMCPACEAPMAGRKAASLAEAAVLVLQERNIDQAERRSLLAKGQAIKNADGSIAYPIGSPADLGPAAVLAKSKHGNYKAGAALVSRMAKKWGVKDPMQEQLAEALDPAKTTHADLTKRIKGMDTRDRIHVGKFAVVKHGALGDHMHSIHGLDGKQVGELHKSPASAATALLRHAKGGKLSEAALRMHSEREAKGHIDKAIAVANIGGGTAKFESHIAAARKELPPHHEAHADLRKAKAAGLRDRKGALMHLRAARGDLTLHEADEWAHLPAHKRPNATALEAARRISPNKGKPDMVKLDRKAFGKALTGVKLTSDEHASARAHAIRTNQLDGLRKARHGKLTESERLLIEAEIDGAKPTAHGGMLDRVKSMKLGDTVRLPSGHAITHVATPDGRKVWRADTPSRWSSSGWSLGDEKRTPEAAVSDAFRLSAASNDPASLGGATRYHSFGRVKVGGKEHRFIGVDAHTAKPEVRDISGVGQPGSIKVVGWDELHPVDDIMQQGDGGVMGSVLDSRLQEADRARRDTIGAIAGKGGPRDTFDFHAGKGKFTKGRAQIHGGMIRHVLDNPKAHDSGPVAMVATRSPSGGAVQTVKGAGSAIPHDAVHISIPAMRERVPEHAALKLHSTADETAATDREARHVGKLAATMALMRGKSVVVHDDPIQESSTGDQRTQYTRLRSLGASHADAMRRAAAHA
jgi:hypothetical protein